ncbi:MAG TPA: TPM domain-containing protein [bacterium]|nr:TPM domain-containing protein [bacterium]HPG44858.1 TPM domain-containing protein [bacterium]HPM98113.1 TPM domain-containing protein [bacterium]
MKKCYLLYFVLLLLCFAVLSAMDVPAPRGAVNDFANVISAEDEKQIEELANEVWEKAGVAMVVATFDSVPDDDYNGYATLLYEKWGIGKQGEDNGVLILNVVQTRRLRIEVGYGLEPVLTDSRSGRIFRDILTPHLRAGDYGGGFLAAFQTIAGLVSQDTGIEFNGQTTDFADYEDNSEESVFGGFCSFLALIIILIILARLGLLPWILLSGSSSGHHGGFGGTFGGGGFGGGFGSSGGGGFGGFGGGMSGGGGAGGSY